MEGVNCLCTNNLAPYNSVPCWKLIEALDLSRYID